MSGKQTKTRADRSKGRVQQRKSQKILCSQGGVTVILCVVVVLVLFVCGWFMTGGQGQWNGWLKGASAAQADSTSDDMTGRLAYRKSQPAELGEYSVMRYDNLTEVLMRVEFTLVGETSCQDETQFERFMGANAGSFRKQVCQTVREARVTELSDPDILARKITTQVNRVHGETFLHSVELKNLEILEEVEGYAPTPWRPAAVE